MSDPLDQLKQWREITDAVGLTPGPWEWWAAHTLREDTPHPRRTHPRTVLKSQDNWSPSPEDAEFIVTSRTAMPALLTAVENVLDLHRPFKVYDECECTDERKDDGYHVEVNDIGLTCNHIYTVCGECCTDDEYVTEACSYHVHREGEPICPTVKAIRDALGGAQ